VSRESVIEYAKSLANLPTLNTLTGKLPSLLQDEDVSLSRLSDLISYDPGLSFRLISAANSPWHNRGNRVTSVGIAVSLLGLDEVRNLVTCAIFYDGILKKSGLRRKDTLEFWRHSLLTGFATRTLANDTRRNGDDPSARSDESFTAGLLHDIGKIPFVVNPDLRSATVLSWHDSTMKEREKFGIDHCEVGFLMAREWKLPEGYQYVIKSHHQERAVRSPERSLAALVGEADFLVTSETEDEECLLLRATAEKEAQEVMDVFSL